MKRHYADYLKNGSYNIELKDSTSVTAKKFLKRIAIHNACLWWQKNQVGWKRLQALVNALKSNDPQRQAGAINFLRFGDTKCTGLTKEYYLQNILPLISNLTTSKDELVSEQAKYLFSDREYYYWWYEFNPKRKRKH